MSKHLLDLFERGRHWSEWYQEGKREIWRAASFLGLDPVEFTATLAITSPRVSVSQNIRITLGLLTGTLTRGILVSTQTALANYHTTGKIRGPKTRAFFEALSGCEDAVVLDTHMAKALSVDQKEFGTKAGYELHSSAIRTLSRKTGLSPARTQASIWCGTLLSLNRTPARLSIVSHLPTLFQGVPA